jgi:hypothetical protein
MKSLAYQMFPLDIDQGVCLENVMRSRWSIVEECNQAVV